MATMRALLAALALTQVIESSSSSGQTADLERGLAAARDDALLLYTQYTTWSAKDMTRFLLSAKTFGKEFIEQVDTYSLSRGKLECRRRLDGRVRQLRHNAHVAAQYNAENHHKYILAHMIVLRIHLNKTENFVKKAQQALAECGSPCNDTMRWPQLMTLMKSAEDELSRVRGDMEFSRTALKDLHAHGQRRLVRIKKKAEREIIRALAQFKRCCNTT